MTNFIITYRDLTIDLDSIKSFYIGAIDYERIWQRTVIEENKSLVYPHKGHYISLSPKSDSQIIFDLGGKNEIWYFENNSYAKTAFDFLTGCLEIRASARDKRIKELDKRTKEIVKLKADLKALKAQYDDLFPSTGKDGAEILDNES